MLSAEQALFYATCLGGHSIILTGQGGTEKTFVLDFLAKELTSRGLNVAVTCSTGIAATKYERGQTLHKWCGIGAIGGYCLSKLRNKNLKKVRNSLFDPKKERKLSEN